MKKVHQNHQNLREKVWIHHIQTSCFLFVVRFCHLLTRKKKEPCDFYKIFQGENQGNSPYFKEQKLESQYLDLTSLQVASTQQGFLKTLLFYLNCSQNWLWSDSLANCVLSAHSTPLALARCAVSNRSQKYSRILKYFTLLSDLQLNLAKSSTSQNGTIYPIHVVVVD